MSIFWTSEPRRRRAPGPTWSEVVLVSVVAGTAAAVLVVGLFS
jgi:hypothetical protein